MRDMLSKVLLVCFIFCSIALQAQDTGITGPSLEGYRKDITEKFNSKYKLFSQSKNEILLRANQKGIPILIPLEYGNFAELKYFDEFGFPIYLTTYNNGAAASVGTNSLQPGGSLGQSLTGKGFVVGIYDQTRPKPDHTEFTGRLTQIDGSTETISNHATHVSGTVLAAGINAAARGMAYEATGWSFNWDSDLSKMFANSYEPTSKPNGHLVSNHSYGFLTGWFRNSTGAWQWAGNNSVDPNEDYRFGYYSSKSQGLDDLVFIRPYYTIVWAAGNDRTDVGNGTKPSDGPDDTIGSEGVAKNIITVGAVSVPSAYTGPTSVAMSSFSSWGPTDDGRIKPDLVAVGVNVFSSTVANGGTTDSYGSLSGTSMASPNVTGSLLLLQQLYSQRNNGRFMWASTVKSLVLNTTKEAGLNLGPDYVYGWGLLDVEAAGRIILNDNGTSDVIREVAISNGGNFEFDFVSDGVSPIRVTIAWTDPAGSPPPISVDPQNLMLVNDLDLRVIDEAGVTYFPWSLNPAAGSSAQAVRDRDNFRDNVEQILIESPKAQKYTVKISHKGNLIGGKQEVSLVLKAGTTDGADETLYWIGNSTGDWNNPSNWSASPNGTSANKIPSAKTRVVFDGSGTGNQTVGFPGNAEAFSVNFFGDRLVKFDLKGNQITLSNGFRVSNQITEIENGRLIFQSSSQNENLVELGQALFTNTTLDFKSGKWTILSAEVLDELIIDKATLKINQSVMVLGGLDIKSEGSLVGNLRTIEFKKILKVAATGVLPQGLNLKFGGTSGELNNLSEILIEGLSVQSGVLTHTSGKVGKLSIQGSEYRLGSSAFEVSTLELGPSAQLNFGTTGELTVRDSISTTSTSTAKAKLIAGNKGILKHDLYLKYCLNHVSASNVDLQGQAVINLGLGAELVNSTGWVAANCEDVLFANFNVSFACAGSAITFQNLSEGSIATYAWDFNGLGTSALSTPTFVFTTPGLYTVTLVISNPNQTLSFEKEISISTNDLPKPIIVINGSQLTSQQPGSQYQWFINGQPIVGANQRSFEALGDGSYQVAIFNDACNRLSDPVVISALPESGLSSFGIFIGPIPTQNSVDIRISNEFVGPVNFALLDLAGREYFYKEVIKDDQDFYHSIDLPNPQGLYILRIQTNNLILHKKVIKY